ncbi:MAG: hypothetical protein ACKOX6_09745 [Bdellovibrio sp.]
MKFIKFFTPLAFLLSIAQVSQADDLKTGGLFIEPALTYQTGTIDVNFPSPLSDSKEDVKGFGLGLRLGGHAYESLFVALDGRYSRPTYDSSALGGSGAATAYNAGLTLGVQTPVAGLRVWGTYILTGNMDPEKIRNVDVKLNDLKGFRVGAGLYIASLSLNLEYQDAKYDSTTVEEAGPLSGNLDGIDGKDKSYILSVSFPVSL